MASSKKHVVPFVVDGNNLLHPDKKHQLPLVWEQDRPVEIEFVLTFKESRFLAIEFGEFIVYQEEKDKDGRPWEPLKAAPVTPDPVVWHASDPGPRKITIDGLPLTGPFLLTWTVTGEVADGGRYVVDPPPVDIKP